MCLNIFTDPGKAFAQAAKRKSMPRTIGTLVVGSAIASAALTIMSLNISLAPWIFALVIGMGIITGFVVKVIANALGTKGGFYEGLTAIAYSTVPIATGIFLMAALNRLPVAGLILGYIVAMVMFGLGFAVLYRGIRDLFKTDMITAFVIVFIFGLTFLAATQFFVSLNMLMGLGGLVP
jgi:Yip1 domain